MMKIILPETIKLWIYNRYATLWERCPSLLWKDTALHCKLFYKHNGNVSDIFLLTIAGPPPPPHTQTYAHTHTHAHTRTHARKHACTQARRHAHTHQTPTHTCMHACMHTYIHIHSYIHKFIHACMHACIYIHMHMHTCFSKKTPLIRICCRIVCWQCLLTLFC